MSWLVAVPLAILLAVLGVVLVLVTFPFHARARGGVHGGELTGSIGLSWAFGLLGVELRPRSYALRLAGLRLRRAYPARAQRQERERRRARQEERARPGREGRRATLGHVRRLLRMAARVLRALHLRLRLRGEVGTGDPADTAVLSGLLQAASVLPGIEPMVELDWLDEVLELEAEGSARVWVPELAAVAVLLLLRHENRAALRALRS